MNKEQPPYAAIASLMKWAVIETAGGHVPAKQLNAMRGAIHLIVAPYRRALRNSGRPTPVLNRAETFLVDGLARGPQLVTNLLTRAKQKRISEKTLRRAADKLGVRKHQRTAMERAFWIWELGV